MTLTVTSDLNGPNPQFTLTCISTGGPATTVTWTRDSTTVTEGTETVLNDQATEQYTHTLTVSGRPEGLYTCTVSNNKPSEDSVQLKIDGQYIQIGNYRRIPSNLLSFSRFGRSSREIYSQGRRKGSDILLVSSTCHPAQWEYHRLHPLLLPLPLLPPQVHLLQEPQCDWILSQHSLHLLRGC